MLTADQAAAFLAAAVLITLSPGPDNLMVLGLGMSRGRAAGMVFGLGCALGCLSHTLLAVAGVSALIAASPTAFLALKIAGGLYLLWLGVQALKSSGAGAPGGGGDAAPAPLIKLFGRGLIANAINPKVLLFFLAFLPQFVDAARGSAAAQIAQLGILFTLQAALLFTSLGYSAGHVGRWLTRKPRAGLWLDRGAGIIFLALGLRLLILR